MASKRELRKLILSARDQWKGQPQFLPDAPANPYGETIQTIANSKPALTLLSATIQRKRKTWPQNP